jgi:hypothetical protein
MACNSCLSSSLEPWPCKAFADGGDGRGGRGGTMVRVRRVVALGEEKEKETEWCGVVMEVVRYG